MTIGLIIYTKGVGFKTFIYRGNYNKGYLNLLQRYLGTKTQNGVYSTANYICALKVILCLLLYRLISGLVIRQTPEWL